MKTIKGLATFIFLAVLFGSCFSPPEFSIVPSIGFEDLVFKENPDPSFKDSLILTINFQDGDGDLGLSGNLTDFPYHSTYYYLVNGTDSIAIGTYNPYEDLQEILLVPDGVKGKLVTVRTRENPLYPVYKDMFKEYVCPYVNTHYQYDSVLVLEKDSAVFNKKTHNLYATKTAPGQPDIYVLLDTFAIRRNAFHYNIAVDFFIHQGGDEWALFDWKNSCGFGLDFSGRFPVLSDRSNPLEGTLKYAMGTVGFHPFFDGKTLKLRIQIWDRALNASNVIYTDSFTLQSITE